MLKLQKSNNWRYIEAKKITKKLLLVLLVGSFILVPMKIYAATKNVPYNKAICALRMAESRLWIDHVLWTRSFIVSDVASLHDKDEVIQRLLKNQDDIGNSIKPFLWRESRK